MWANFAAMIAAIAASVKMKLEKGQVFKNKGKTKDRSF